MQAAMRLALRGGFSAMTVRQIAREAQVAAGQLHHHFASIGELKSQVFIRLIREMLDMPLVAEDASWRERLFSMIGSEDGRLEPYIRLWREGQVLADSDPDIKAAYLLTMTMWHAETVAIVEQGLACGEFHSTEPPADIAWRFIALVCPFDLLDGFIHRTPPFLFLPVLYSYIPFQFAFSSSHTFRSPPWTPPRPHP